MDTVRTTAELTPEPIFRIATGFMAAKHLFVAGAIGLFESLGGEPLTLEALAQRAGVPRRTARIVADAMVALGMLERQDGTYRNGAVAQAFLSGRGPADLRAGLRLFDRI